MKKLELRRILCLATVLLLVACMAMGAVSCKSNKPSQGSETESSSVTESGNNGPDKTEGTGDPSHTETETADTDTVPPETSGDTTESDGTDGDATEKDTDSDGDGSSSDQTPDKTEPSVTPDKTEPVVTPDKTEPVVTPDKTEPTVTPDKTEPTVTPDKTEPTVTPDKTEPSVKPDETESPEETTIPGDPECEHQFDGGVITKQPTVFEEGVKVYTCTLCGATRIEKLPKLEAVYHITMDGYGDLPVPADGSYSLPHDLKVGYTLVKWIDANGNEFASSGVINSSVTVYPVFELAPTKTVEELYERAEAGVDYILIANDIVIDRTIYVTGETVIYSEKSVKLIRAEGFAGDMFVVGQNSEGLSSIINPDFIRRAKLTLGKPEWTDDVVLLTIDGNRDNVTAKVEGSAFFLIYGADVDLYHGVAIVNHVKVGNERAKATSPSFYVSSSINSGGAAFFICSGSTLRMYGGLIDNNTVNTTSTVNAEGVAENLSAYGGAIYNNGNVYMYGGVISNNSANRGGAIYANDVVKIFGGVFEGNYAKNKGGAICTSGSDSADLIISTDGAKENTVVLRNNSAGTQGGAILSYFDSPIVIYHGVLFEGNQALGGVGGAISTSGPITAYETKFINNSSTTNGGAIYHIYAGGERIVRIVELEGCYFEGNRANKGGAISITSQDEVKGAILNLKDCDFVNNTAYLKIKETVNSETGEIKVSRYTGNGGAIYSSQHGNVTVIGCTFTGNKAENLGGGAIGATVGSRVMIDDCTFTANSAVDADGEENGISGVGGALYVYNESIVTVKNTLFRRNSAAKNGGAIYCSANTVTLETVEFDGNIAGEHGGAISQHSGNVLTIKGIKAYSNKAKTYGGVINNNQSTLNIVGGEGIVNQIGMLGESPEETELLKNSAASGGAICGANTSIISISKTEFVNNHAIGDGNGDYNRYGGAIYATYGSQIITDDVDFKANGAGYGGAVALMKSTTAFDLSNSKLESNTSTNCGGAAYVLAATIEMTDVEASGNVSAKGGVLYLSSQSKTMLNQNVFFRGNTATYGGAAYVSGAELAELGGAEFTGNGIGEAKPASQGGAIYVISSEVNLDGCLFEGNASTSKGGAICLAATEKNTDAEGVETTTAPAIVSLLRASFNNNSSKNGGAIYASSDSEMRADNAIFTANFAKASETDDDARGGAIYMLGATLVADCIDFEGNGADFYGGAIDGHTGSTITLTNVTFTENSAKGNGGAIWTYTNTVVNITNIIANGNRTESYGGFAYTRGSFSILASEGETNVFEGNSSKSRGGVMAGAADSVLSIENTQFINNSGSSGGAVYSLAETVIKNCTFNNNSASSGGAICVSGGVTTTLDCIFNQNTAKNYGGAVYVTENSLYVDGVSTDGVTDTMASEFTGNSAATGGALYCAGVEDIKNDPDHKGGAIMTNGSVFDSNTATSGGAIGVGKGCVLTDNASTFKNNSAWRGGAIIVVFDDDHPTPEVKAYITNSVFLGNTAKVTETDNNARGGAIYVGEYTTVVMTGVIFEQNSAEQYGGAVSGARGSKITALGCDFSENSSAVNGGAVWTYSGSTIDISDSCFASNTTGSSGGAIYTYGDMNAARSEFVGNIASNGGAIYLASGETHTLECEFVSNEASHGGAILVADGATYVDGTSESKTGGSRFESNKAYRGAAINLEYESKAEDISTVRVKMTLIGSEFAKNAADNTEESTSARGGAIYVGEYTKISIDSADFSENHAGEYGGAISAARGTQVEVLNSSFEGNDAGTRGGAIWKYEDGSFSVGDTLFRNNESKEGGAIRSHVGGSIETCDFTENVAKSGGALYVAAYSVISNCDFVANEATASGGAIYAVSGTASVIDTSFVANVAATNGGAVCVCENASLEYTASQKMTVDGGVVAEDYDGVIFKDNKASNGAAIYLASVADSKENPDHVPGSAALTGATFIGHENAIYTNGALSTTDCVFYKNEGLKTGAAISATGSASYNDIGSVFVENSTTGAQAGALSLAGDTVLKNTKFYRNTAPEGRGGAILASGSSHTLTATGVYFEGNTAKTNGGAVVLSGLKLGTFDGCTFKNNEAGERAGALYGTSKATMATLSCLFEGNTAKTGGAISIATDAPYTDGVAGDTDRGSVFKNNTATGSAGALHLTNTSCLYGTKLEGNSSSSYGGAIYVSADSNIVACSFIGNKAVDDGGAIFMKADVTVFNSSFENNNTSGNGGAIYVYENATLTYTSDETLGVTGGQVATGYNGPVFKNNVAGYGDAIYLAAVEDTENNPDHVAGSATITGATFTEHGNAIYATGVLNTQDCVFYKNSGTAAGSAVSTTGRSTYTDLGSAFVENSSTAQAGAVSLYGNTVLTDSEFYRNSSTANRAGALLATGSEATLTATNCFFEGNTATSHGGAVVLTAHKLATFDGCTFVNNESGSRAGALYGTSNTNTVTISCLFEGNKAVNGGAISTATTATYVDGVEGQTDKGSTFKNNTATGLGGALHLTKAASLYGSTFEGNTSAQNGGAIYTSVEIVLADTSVTANSSGIYAGGDVVVSGTVNVSNNNTYNIYRAEGSGVTLSGMLGEGSVICIETKDADGNYASSFELLQYPMAINGYTMVTTGSASYQWYRLVGGEWTAVDGATSSRLNSAIQGETYKCIASLCENTAESNTLVYRTDITTQSHPVCGNTCDHGDAHESVTFAPIFSAGELSTAMAAGGNYYLADDIVLDATIEVKANVNICLNGKKISRVGEEVFAMISVKEEATLTLTDCGSIQRAGYIDPATKLWVEGEYTGEETVIKVTLNGGLITNGAGVGGRAIYAYGTLNTYGINFAGNFSSSAGGAIYCAGEYNDEGSVFAGNTSSNQAGAVEVHGNTTLNGTKFLYNASTANRAGALLATGSEATLTATNCSFEGNTATSHGGAVVLTGHKLATFDGCNFINNESGSRAGALYGTSNTNTVTISCLFEGNKGVNGGAISTATTATYVDGVEGQTDKGSTFKNNTASELGGALHLTKAASLYGSAFEGNTSATQGGAIYMSKDMTLDGVKFISNTAENGGAVYVAGGTTTAKSCTFENNTATANGGAIYTVNALTLDSCEFTSNSAVDGGAVYSEGDTFTDKNSTFTSNTSTSEGGAIYVTAVASLNGTSFDGNESGPGGAVYIRNKLTNTLIGVTLTNNKGSNGSIYISGAGVTYIEGMEATNNASTGYGGVIYVTTAGTQVTVNSATLSKNTYTKSGIRGFIQTGNATSHVNIYKQGIVEDGLAGDNIPDWDAMIVPKNADTALSVTYLEEPVAIPAN